MATVGQGRIEHRLVGEVRLGRHGVDDGRPQGPQRGEGRLGVVDRPGVAEQ